MGTLEDVVGDIRAISDEQGVKDVSRKYDKTKFGALLQTVK